MEISKLPYHSIPFLSPKDLSYIHLDPRLAPFYQYEPSLDSFHKAIEAKKKQSIDRSLLVEVLLDQYRNIETSDAVKNNIDQLLNDNTFTIITAHQPCLFTGPLYFIYKICSTIHLAKTLNQRFEHNRIVPLFIMGGEDHDFDEMNHLRLNGQKISWKHPRSGGPVGRMSTEGLDKVIDQIESQLIQSDFAAEIVDKLKVYFQEGASYGQGMIQLVNYLFADYGLVILNMDSPKLKARFLDIYKDDLLNNSSYQIVNATQAQLSEKGIDEQAYVREINQFYIGDHSRQRIEAIDGQYVLDGAWVTQEEVLQKMEAAPERFSPNVVLRPLYQEKLIPNLAYIGGGGEIAYWLERKSQFEHYNIPFPILIRRNSVLYLSRKDQRTLDKSGLKLSDLLVDDIEYFISIWIKDNFEASLEKPKSEIIGILKQIQTSAKQIDPTLAPYIGARSTDVEKIIDQMEHKLVKAIKNRTEIETNRIRRVYDSAFPDQSLQERKDSFLEIYQHWGPEWIQYLIEHLDPLDRTFTVIQA